MNFIPPNEVATFRALKSATIILMIMFRLDKPTGETEIAELLDMHPQTVRARLGGLKRLGLVTRTHRYQGWTLTQGGRQLLLGNHPDRGEQTKSETSHNLNLSLSAKNSPSRSPAAAALSLSFNSREQQLAEEDENRARKIRAQNESQIKTSAKFSRSQFQRKCPRRKRKTAEGSPRSGPDMVTSHSYGRNLEAFQSIGLGLSAAVRRIAELDHVTPDYIIAQTRRLEGEGRYSPGLLIKVIRDGDPIPPKYLPSKAEPEPDPEPLPQPEDPGPQADPSVNAPASPNGTTAVRAWEMTLTQLQREMPKSAFETWVRDSRLIAFLNGSFVVYVGDAYARDWLESRLTSTITRLLTGICNRHIEVKFTCASAVLDR